MIYLEAKLPDVPGSLIELIKPISQNGGNIHGVLHHHDKKLNNMIPVDIWFDLSEESIEKSLENIKNDFESSIFIKYPDLKKIKDELYTLGALYATMSGSGSAVYGIYNTLPEIPDSFEGFFTWTGRL